MPIHIQWVDEQHTIIKHVYKEPWTLTDYRELIKENHRLIEESGHTVHVINDMSDLRQLPDDMIPALHDSVIHRHPNECLKVMVSASMLMRILLESVYITMGKDTRTINFVNTIEEALEIIATQSHLCIPHETADSNH